MTTLDTIHKLSNERLNLWRKAGNGGLSRHETQRVRDITTELYNLWDTYRREIASGNRRIESTTRRVNRAA